MLSSSIKKAHDAVFVVTAEGFEERQAMMENELGKENFEFVFGIHKSTTSKEEMIARGLYDEEKAKRYDRAGKAMPLGHICCSIAHLNAYRAMLERGIERALIFEDDAVLAGIGEEKISQIVADIPSDAGLIYWGWRAITKAPFHAPVKKWIYKRQHELGFLPYTHTMIDNLYAKDHSEHFMRAGKTFLAHAYTITNQAARTLLRWNHPVILNADNAIMYAVMNGDIKAYLSKTHLFFQRSIDDDDPLRSATWD